MCDHPHRCNQRCRLTTRDGGSRAAWHGIAVLLLFLTAACASRPETAPSVPPGEPVKGSVYVVVKGDTLYGIAWRHGVDYREIAAANGIGPPYLIRPGQRLEVPAPGLSPESDDSAKGASREAPLRPSPVRPVVSESPVRARPTERGARDTGGVQPPPPRDPVGTATANRWRWPVPDAPVRGFDAESKSVEYQLDAGAAVRSATGGVVVYAGPGLGGFSHLVIVKPDDRHLVAYALNVAPAVAQGVSLRPGDLVARLGGGRDARRLRFEARDRGEPIDPARLIGTGPAR